MRYHNVNKVDRHYLQRQFDFVNVAQHALGSHLADSLTTSSAERDFLRGSRAPVGLVFNDELIEQSLYVDAGFSYEVEAFGYGSEYWGPGAAVEPPSMLDGEYWSNAWSALLDDPVGELVASAVAFNNVLYGVQRTVVGGSEIIAAGYWDGVVEVGEIKWTGTIWVRLDNIVAMVRALGIKWTGTIWVRLDNIVAMVRALVLHGAQRG